MNIYLVIPAYNEGERLHNILKKTKKHISASKTIIVDDGSVEPIKFSKKDNFILLRHKINLGKGSAMKTGIEYAFSQKADAVIFMDSDGQHDPKELTHFKKYLNKGYDLVFASRKLDLNAPLIRMLGNKFASIYINLLFGIYISDIPSGYRAITQKAYKYVKWVFEPPPGYSVETEMIARLGKHKNKLKWIEFPIDNIYIDKYKGMSIADAIKILGKSIWWKIK